VISFVLAAALVVTGSFSGFSAVYAGAPQVAVDEAMYVNLDPYGAIEDASLVKGCTLNGVRNFKDFGDYKNVTNMSSYDKPVIEKDGVSFSLKDQDLSSRFYFNCQLKKKNLELPWNFDISYKLNGVSVTPEEIAGASGLVEIDIAVTPNPKAKEYYRNNMLLQVGTVVDMEEAYSLEAPGSQLQSAGTYKAVLFAALPGEKTEYAIRIGTDSFSSAGITMMMIPGTLEQLQQIKDLKEAKDTLQESGDAVYYALNDMLTTMQSMKMGITALEAGTAGLEDARSTFSGGRDELSTYSDQALKDLKAVNGQLKDMIPYFETAQKMNDALIGDIGGILSSLEDLEDPLDDTKSAVSSLNAELSSLQTMLTKLNTQIKTNLTNLSATVADPATTNFDKVSLQGDAAVATILSSYEGNMEQLLKSSVALGKSSIDIINVTKELTGEADDLNDTLHEYRDDVNSMIKDCGEMTTLLNSSLDSTILFLSYSRTLLKESGDKLDAASATTLSGMADILDKTLLGMKSIDSMKRANQSIKSTIDDELDSIEEENQFINLDAEAPLISFTSDKNPAPQSVQIILKTPEIDGETAEDDTADLEPQKEDLGFLERLVAIFRKIFSVFH